MQSKTIRSSRTHALLSESRMVSLTPAEQLQLFHLLENPSPINEKLSKAIERYKQLKANDGALV